MTGIGRRSLAILMTVGLAAGGIAATAQEEAATPYSIAGVTHPGEMAELADWVETARQVTHSEAFAQNLVSASGDGEIFLRIGWENEIVTGDAGQLLAILAANRPPYRLVPPAIALSGDQTNFNAFGGWTGYADEDGFQYGAMTIGRGNLKRWQSDDPVEKSCAVNTMAHELTHAISIEPRRLIYAISDYARRNAPAGTPAASYLVGSVAQCTWLQQQGRVPEDGLADCLAVFGTRHFNSCRCSSFGDGLPVELRSGLPPPATDDDQSLTC